MAEAGFPEVDTQLWSGFFVPVGTPAPIVTKLTAELGKALVDPCVQDGLKKMAVTPGGPTGDAFKTHRCRHQDLCRCREGCQPTFK
jgi:tripartite-type tricarboxylate transporter receptor subunit TctC